MFNYEKIMKPNVVVHCPTEDQANVLLQWAHNQGLRWCTNQSYLENNHWHTDKENSCYNLYLGRITSKKWYSNKCFTIYRFEDVVIRDNIISKNKKRKVKCLNKNVEMENKEEDVVLNNNISKNKKRKVKCLNKNVEIENKEDEKLNYILELLKSDDDLKNNIYNLVKRIAK